jgi:hypothetical protein
VSRRSYDRASFPRSMEVMGWDSDINLWAATPAAALRALTAKLREAK